MVAGGGVGCCEFDRGGGGGVVMRVCDVQDLILLLLLCTCRITTKSNVHTRIIRRVGNVKTIVGRFGFVIALRTHTHAPFTPIVAGVAVRGEVVTVSFSSARERIRCGCDT